MIGGVVSHCRTKRDAGALRDHLLKDAGASVEVVNSAAPSLDEALWEMQWLRDGTRAEAAALHSTCRPPGT